MPSVFKRKYRRWFFKTPKLDAAGQPLLDRRGRPTYEWRRAERGAPGAVQRLVASQMWYGYCGHEPLVDDAGQPLRTRTGKRRLKPKRVALSSDKTAAKKLLQEKLGHEERRRRGALDSSEQHAKTPLTEHLAAFRVYLEANGRSKSHVADTVRYVNLVAAAGAISFLGDIHADRVEQLKRDLALRPMRSRKKAKAGEVLEPEPPAGPRTINGYVDAVKSFCAWCVQTGRLAHNPLAHVKKLNARVDPRRVRRALTADELARLIAAAEASETVFRTLDGPDRAMLYATAAGTGLRASELASLTTASLTLAGDVPLVVVAASKHREQDNQPLPGWLATKLAAWLAERREAAVNGAGQLKMFDDGAAKLWPGSWAERGAEMLRGDLEAAKLLYCDASGRYFDFHSLRVQFGTTLAAAGVHPKKAQELLRHKSIELTMGVYTKLAIADVAGALEDVPNPFATRACDQLQATGTSGDKSQVDSFGAPDFVGEGRNVSRKDKSGKRGKTREIADAATESIPLQHLAAITVAEGMGLEPTTGFPAPEFQSSAEWRKRRGLREFSPARSAWRSSWHRNRG